MKTFVFRQRKAYNSFAKAKVSTTWYLKNQYDERLDSVTTTDVSGSFLLYGVDKAYSDGELKELNPYARMVADAVETSYIKLLSNSSMQKQLQSETIKPFTESVLNLGGGQAYIAEKSDASLASVSIKRKDKGHGSGFAVSKDGYILTNYHVIASSDPSKQEELTVVTSSGKELPAKVVRFNKSRDLALLKVESNFDKVFKISSDKTFKNLQDVYTIGTPKSIELGQSVTTGIISSERNANNNELLQLNMSVNSGNSGGPVFDANGNLHGVVVSKISGQNTEGIAFAIPAYKIAEYLNIAY